MKVVSACLVLLTSIGCAITSRADTTAPPVITLATGTYAMPTSTTIIDSTPGASIAWCFTATGACVPATAYTGSIFVNPATMESICANATAPGSSTSSTVCAVYTAAPALTATPVITLGTGTYVMPTSTTITDLTSGASIKWCSTRTGTCTPAIPYKHEIMVHPPAETICANATSSDHPPSNTACNSYTAGQKSDLSFSYSDGQVTMSSSLSGATIFYTLDGSTATEASIEYTAPVPVAPGTVIHAAAVQMVNNGATGVAVQNGQINPNNFKTVLSSSAAQSAPYLANYNSPHVQYGSGNNTCTQGVCGIPTEIGMIPNQPLPSVTGSSTVTNFNMTTQNLSGAGSGLQVLWPYNASSGTTPPGGCDSCTSMIEDFYIWPQYTSTINPANVENWELDMNSWNLTIPTYGYLGAAFQCSIIDGGWQYNGQHSPGWTNFSSTGFASMTKINHDCQLPFGTLSAPITSATQQSFTVTPNVTGSVTAATVEPGMILVIDNEEILCTASSGNTCTESKRGWAGTGATPHAAGALYMGSVHVQYHVTLAPGQNACLLNGKSGAPVECVFIDYMILNNVKYDFHDLYGEQTVNGVPGYSALTVPAYIYTFPPDRVYDQKQIDVKGGIGSPSSPVEVGEYIDRDNVTASFGVLASRSFTVPCDRSHEHFPGEDRGHENQKQEGCHNEQ